MTVPLAWRHRRLRVPEGLVLHYADLSPSDKAWHGPVPLTIPAQTVRDCMSVGVSLEFIEQAIRQGDARGLFARDEVPACAPPPSREVAIKTGFA